MILQLITKDISLKFFSKIKELTLDIYSGIFHDKSFTSSIPDNFQNSEPSIICYKYNKQMRNILIKFSKLVSDFDIDANTPDSRECKDSNFFYPSAGHVVTGNLKIIPNSKIRNNVS